MSATFAAAGMMRLGDKLPDAPYPTDKQAPQYPVSASVTGPGFSSVSSIVHAVSTVSFPPIGNTIATTPAEVSLPPSTYVKAEVGTNSMHVSASGLPAATQTPINSSGGMEIQQPGSTPVSQMVGSSTVTGPPVSAPIPGMNIPLNNQGMMPNRMPGVMGPHGPGPHQLLPGQQRMVMPPGVNQPGQRPRNQRQQPNYNQPRYQLPSNLPPHLAGMLYNQRPNKAGYQQSPERHMEPMGQARFPPGHPMSMPPRGFPGQPQGEGMHMQPGPRHPGMMQHPGMRHAGMRPMAGQGHPMTQMHPGQMSPGGHPGMPMHHPGQGPRMMGPPGMPHVMPSQTPPELSSPTLRQPSAPLTPGSMPSTPSPTPSSYPLGVNPPTSVHMGGMVRTPTPPGFPGDPYHQQFQRMPFDPNMSRPGSEERQMHNKLPPGFPFPGMPHNKDRIHESMSAVSPMDDVVRQMAAGQSGAGGFPGHQLPGHITSTAGSTLPTPVTMVKQEPTGELSTI